MRTFDVIVIGVGGMGSAAVHQLALRGLSVLGLERYTLGHDQGSSHGHTRIIRKAYFEHPSYVPLVERAETLWANLEQATGRTLIHRVGLLLAGRPDGRVIEGVERAARQHSLAIEAIAPDERAERFPGFWFDPEMEVLFESQGGFLDVDGCVQSQIEQALAHGATILENQTVEKWVRQGQNITVTTADEQFAAQRLILCGGPWSLRLLADLNLPLIVRRKPVFWYEPQSDVYDITNQCPVFAFDLEDGIFYGFPNWCEQGLKVGNHGGGETVTDVEQIDRSLRAEDQADIERSLTRHLPQCKTSLKSHSVCMYTMTPDEHFVVDRHRDHENVFFAAGFSGHGFKFAPIIGSVLADLATTGETNEPVDFLSASRPALRSPSGLNSDHSTNVG